MPHARNHSSLRQRRMARLLLPVALLAFALLSVLFVMLRPVHANRQAAATTIPGDWTSSIVNTPDDGAQLVLLHDGRVMDTYLNSNPATANIYDPSMDKWTMTAPLDQEISWNAAAELSNGDVMLIGGFQSCSEVVCFLASAHIYNPTNDSWTDTTPMSTQRAGATAIVLRNGKILVTGGVKASTAIGWNYLNSAELYDPATRLWTSAGNMAFARSGQSAVLLNDGRVFVIGGSIGVPNGNANGIADCGVQCPQFVPTPEIYDPATNHWSTAAPIPDAYQQFTVTVLPTGKVLLAGAFDSATNTGTFSTNLLYDPVANTWSTAAPMVIPRIGQVAALLPTGNVLVEGGQSAHQVEVSAEEYNPFTNTWTATASIGSFRAHTYGSAIVLADGRVMVNGGTYCGPGCGAPPRRVVTNAGPMQPKSSGPSPNVDVFSTIPGLVTNLHATAGNGTATVTWAPALSDGRAITGYTFTSRPGNISKTVKGNATSATITGLADGTSYTFTVTASNGFGAGPASAPSNSVVPSATPVPTPTPSNNTNNGTGNGTGSGSSGGPTADAATPTATSAAGADSTPVAQVAQPQQQQPTVVSRAAPPPSSQFPVGLAIGLLVLLALLIGGGAAFLISRSRRSGTM